MIRRWLGWSIIVACALALFDAHLAQGRVAPTATAARPTARKPPAARPSKLPFDTADGPRVVLAGATLHVGDGRVIDDAVIELQGPRIVRVTAGGDPPAGARVVDLRGKRITPGLVAAATSLGLVEIDMEGSTRDDAEQTDDPIRAAHDASTAIHADSSLIPIQAVDGITSAAVSPTGGLISGQVAWIDLVAGDHRTIVSRAGVAMLARLGQTYGSSRAATLARLQEVLDDARFYARNRAAFDRRQSRDLAAHRLDLAALAPVIAGDMKLHLHADRTSDILAAVELARRDGLQVVILGGAQAWRVAEVLADARVPVIVQPTANLPGDFDHLGARLDNAALLHAAGVEVGIAVLGEAHNVRNVTQEAGIAIAHGLPPEAALAAVTLVPARAYGMEGDYGSVEPGKVANLVVWSGDPFELSTVPDAVWIRGAPIDLTTRQTELRDRYLDLSRFHD